MRETFIQHAKYDVDCDQRRQQQQRLRTDRLLEGLHIAGEIGMDDVGNMHLGDRLLERRGGVLDRGIGRQIVGDGHRRELALMVDHKSARCRARCCVTADSGTCALPVPGT